MRALVSLADPPRKLRQEFLSPNSQVMNFWMYLPAPVNPTIQHGCHGPMVADWAENDRFSLPDASP